MNEKSSLWQDAKVIALVGLAHGTSHFYHVILTALVPWLRPEFHLTYFELGLLMTVFFVVSGIGQVIAGFLVDRLTALPVLLGGLGLLGASMLLLSGAQSYRQLMLGTFIAGCGNCVFHPADFTLLNQRVSKARLAHGFSVHGIGGSIGWALSPLFLTFVASRTDWRTALMCVAFLPLVALTLLICNRRALRTEPFVASATGSVLAAPQISQFSFLGTHIVWLCFTFFFVSAMAMAGIQTFAAASLISLYGMTTNWANSAYTSFMFSSVVGMLYGGFLSANNRDYDHIIILTFGSATALACILATAAVPVWMAIVLMGLIGLMTGISGPSRDLMIRNAAPANATGRVFGVVYSGLDCGLAVGPLIFGELMDAGHPSSVFIAIGIFYALVILTMIGVGNNSRTAVV